MAILTDKCLTYFYMFFLLLQLFWSLSGHARTEYMLFSINVFCVITTVHLTAAEHFSLVQTLMILNTQEDHNTILCNLFLRVYRCWSIIKSPCKFKLYSPLVFFLLLFFSSKMTRGHQKIQSQQRNAKKQAEQKKAKGHDQKSAAKAALVFTCSVCRVSFARLPQPKSRHRDAFLFPFLE